MILICISLMATDVKIFLCYYCSCKSLEKYLFKSFAHFEMHCLFVVQLWAFIYSAYDLQIFSPTWTLPYYFLNGVLWGTEVLYFLLLEFFWGVLKKLLLNYIWALSSTLLSSISVLIFYFRYCSFVISLEIRKYSTSRFVLSDCFDCLESLRIPNECEDPLFYFCGKRL